MYKAFDGGPLGLRLDFEEAVQLAAHHGFDGIYLDVPYLLENGPETVVQEIEERALRAAGWPLGVPLLGSGSDFGAETAHLRRVAEAAARASCLRCYTWIAPGSDELTGEEMRDLLCRRLATVGDVLAEHDIRLGLEFIGPKTSRAKKAHEFVHTMEGMLELCEASGASNVGLLLDCWHLYTSGGDMDDVLGLTDEQIVDVHINDAPAGVEIDEQIDNVRCMPGETGIIDVPRFLRNLKQIGYSGPVKVEPFSERVRQMEREQAIQETRDAMDAVWPDD
jgi:sugar phosphate isomerase/epimerase